MGDDEGGADGRRELLAPFRLDDALLDAARDDAVALHCLPGTPRGGDLRRAFVRAALGGLGPSREPPACPESADGNAAG